MGISEGDMLNEAEKAEIKDILGYGSSIPDGKQNVHTFLFNVATADDTLKLGFLKENEIGNASNPVRAFQHLKSFAKEIMGTDELATYFGNQSEIITASSLSREGFLVDRAVIQKRELKDGSKIRKENKSWFKSKNTSTEGDNDNQ